MPRNTFRGGNTRFQVSTRNRKTYPQNWNQISAAVARRDGHRCKKCNKTQKDLDALNALDGGNRRFERHHLFSVRTGNNRKTNVINLCSTCHSKMPDHKHLKKKR